MSDICDKVASAETVTDADERTPKETATGGTLPAAVSPTHQHLLCVINTHLKPFADERSVRILDLGCGDGLMIAWLQSCLGNLRPDIDIEVSGLDVTDHGVQVDGYFDTTLAMLKDKHPDVAWDKRLHAITSTDQWPFEDGTFDIIFSNMVLEHVEDHDFVFSETQRCLCDGGVAAHLFPIRESVIEGHLKIPFAHRMGSHDLRTSWIAAASRMGMGQYRKHKEHHGISVEKFAEEHADFLWHFTNYRSERELYQCAKQNNLRASFGYTAGFYGTKLRSIFGRPAIYSYKRKRSAFFDKLAMLFLKRVAAVTLFLEKTNNYHNRVP